ncbi:MAG: trehalose-phosphatase [Candidatus Acidiferrales bacterium]
MDSAAAQLSMARIRWKQRPAREAGGARSAFRAWPEIAARLRSAKRWMLLLDFDGTLVNMRSRPEDVRMPQRVKRILERLVRHPGLIVAIVSGRKVRELRKLIGVAGLHYFGLHGAEGETERTALSKTEKAALGRSKRSARARLKGVAGIWIEDKGAAFAIHYRGANPAAAAAAKAALCELLAPMRDDLYVLNGKKVWEVLPRGLSGKGAAVAELVDGQPGKVAAVYVGDDYTDEGAFQALADQITVRVGEKRGTKAHFYLRKPADVLRFLARIEREAPLWKEP